MAKLTHDNQKRIFLNGINIDCIGHSDIKSHLFNVSSDIYKNHHALRSIAKNAR